MWSRSNKKREQRPLPEFVKKGGKKPPNAPEPAPTSYKIPEPPSGSGMGIIIQMVKHDPRWMGRIWEALFPTEKHALSKAFCYLALVYLATINKEINSISWMGWKEIELT